MSGAAEPRAPRLFPVFLRVEGRDVCVVGGGSRALEKVPALLTAGARVTVVAPQVDAALRALEGVRVVERAFEPADLDAAWYVVAAAPPDVNAWVAAEAARRRLWVNAVDDVAHATAWLGAVVERAGFTFAISSHGRAPALAALVRRGLEALLPEDLDRWRELAEAQRDGHRTAGVPFSERRRRLFEAIRALYEPTPHGGAGSTVHPSPEPPQASP